MQITLCSLAKRPLKGTNAPERFGKKSIIPLRRCPRMAAALFAMALLLAPAVAAPAKIIYVDKSAPGGGTGESWDAAYTSIQTALAVALPGDQIRIAQGAYDPGSLLNRYVLKNGVAYMGGYAGLGHHDPNERDFEKYTTILTGDRDRNDSDVEDFTKLAEDPNRDENFSNILYAEDLDDQTILDGFTISGGTDNSGSALKIYNSSIQVANCIITRNSGYAVEITRQSHPTFTNCTFLENAAHSYRSRGGGMEIDYDCQATLLNCTFERNYRCGIQNEGKTQITNCTFIGNIGTGINNQDPNADGTILTNCIFTGNQGTGVSNSRCSPVIRACIFMANSGSSGSAICSGDADPTIIDCIFKANYANSGGAIYNGSGAPLLINCIFAGNRSEYGGGAMLNGSGSRALIVNCTFTGNSAQRGGAICNDDDGVEAKIANSILWGNTAPYGPQIAFYEPYYTPSRLSKISINYSNIEGGLGAIFVPSAYFEYGSAVDWGFGNIDADPFFANPDGADRIFGTEDDNPRLLPGSPCINAGDNSAVPPSISLDLDGDPRIADGVVDMGAYEGPDQTILLSVRSLAVPEGSTAQFTVALAMDPMGPVEVEVGVHSGDSDITVASGASLSFSSSDYALPQTVTLAAAEDPDRFTGHAIIRATASGFDTVSLAASELENEPYPDTILVDLTATGTGDGASWPNAYTDLNAAIRDANSIREINKVWVAQGTYAPAAPSGDRAASFRLVNGVAVLGGFGGLRERGRPGIDEPGIDLRDTTLYETILSGDLNGDDWPVSDPCDLMTEPTRSENSYHVVTAIDCNHTAVIDGFTITGGNANGPEGQSGGGIYGGEATVSNCKITANSASNSAGGISGYRYSSDLGIVKDCVIASNAAPFSGGIAASRIQNCIVSNNRATIGNSGAGTVAFAADCTFENNSAVGNGGVIAGWNESPKFIRCSFTGNSAGLSGGVLHVDGCGTCSDSYPDFQQCTFIENYAKNEGGVVYSTSNSCVNFTNCLLRDNSAEDGGGAIYDDSYFGCTLANCTIIRNSSPDYSAAFVKTAGYACTLYNCILWNNFTSDNPPIDKSTPISVSGLSSGLNIYYSCVQGWTGSGGGDGNTGEYPRFRDPNNGDFRLSGDSPCIDAGDNTAVAPTILVDIEGNPRFLDDPDIPDTGYGAPPIVDMGAYESCSGDFLLNTYALSILEGATAEFTVALAEQPPGSVEVTVFTDPNDPDITVQSGHSLLFDANNYSQPQTVVLTAAEDEDYFDGRTAVRISAAGLVTAALTAREIDNEPAPEVLYVDAGASDDDPNGATWPEAFPDLQTPLQIAANRVEVKEIRVASGSYSPEQPNSHRIATFELARGLAVYGGFPQGGGPWEDRDPNINTTTLTGDLNGDDQPDFANTDDNSYHVVTVLQGDPNTVLDGFTITGGNADGHGKRDHTLGGGIYGRNATIRNCIIARNYAQYHGGGMYIVSPAYDDLKTTVANCTFTENHAETERCAGAGLFIDDDSRVELIECAFKANIVEGYYCAGGGLFIDDYSEVELIGCAFTGNIAEGDHPAAGALFNDRGSKADLIDCTFTDNRAEGYWAKGGAILNDNPSVLNCTNCQFTGNSVTGDITSGGVLYDAYNSDSNFLNCTFTANRAPEGGAIAHRGDTLHLTNCVFKRNTAFEDSGGAILGNAESLIGCTFIQNSAAEFGGAIYGGSEPVTNCSFLGNRASFGGAFATQNASTARFSNCLFSGNSAVLHGGAIYGNNAPAYFFIINCTLTANTAGERGGALYANYSNGSNLIYNSILWDNFASEGPDIQNQSSYMLAVYNSNIEGVWVGYGNIEGDPCFVRDPNDGGDGWGVGDNDDFGDLRLRPESPCIDAGDNERFSQETNPYRAILDGDCNDTAVIDMGAYEFDFTDFGDLAPDCRVDAKDYAFFADRWKDSPCNEANNFCDLADIDRRNSVDFPDLLILARNWLATSR